MHSAALNDCSELDCRQIGGDDLSGQDNALYLAWRYIGETDRSRRREIRPTLFAKAEVRIP